MTEETIFLAAIELPDPVARAAYLAAACAADPGLRAQVDALLAAHTRTGAFLDVPAGEQLRAAPTAAYAPAGGPPPGDGAEVLPALRPYLRPPARPGSLGRLGPYELLEVVGRGGFGVVFRAADDALGRDVAVKVLAPALAATSPARKRFLREARAAARVRHENVVPIHTVEEAPVPYLVMEYVAGGTLQQRIDRAGPLDLPEFLRIATGVARGLAAAHAEGLVHRDVKPGNILLAAGAGGGVKLTDFGLARAVDDASQTQSGLIAGTPLYMSPEQARGEAVDHRSDLFSLGSVLYVMASGRPPFRAPTTIAVLRRVCDDTPRPIPEVVPDVPPWVCGVIARLHAKAAAARYRSAAEVVAALAGPPAGRGGGPGGRGRWGRRAAAAAGLAAVVALAAGLAAVRPRADGGPPADPPPPPDRGADAAGGPAAPGPPPPRVVDDETRAWEQRVLRLPAEEQVAAVVARLAEKNPRFGTGATPTIEAGTVVGLKLDYDAPDLSPVRALTGLKRFQFRGTGVGPDAPAMDLSPLRGVPLEELVCEGTPVADLGPLRGMPLKVLFLKQTRVTDLGPLRGMPIENLACEQSPLADLAPLKGMPLHELHVGLTEVADLSPLKGMPLRIVNVAHTRVADLSPLAGAPLKTLHCRGTSVTDFSPLRNTPIHTLACDLPSRQTVDLLRSIPSLQWVNERPLAELAPP